MSTRSLSSVEKNLFFVGLTLIVIGIFCNEWLLTKLLSPDGAVEIQNRVAVWLVDIVCIFLGLCLMKMGKLIFLGRPPSPQPFLSQNIGMLHWPCADRHPDHVS